MDGGLSFADIGFLTGLVIYVIHAVTRTSVKLHQDARSSQEASFDRGARVDCLHGRSIRPQLRHQPGLMLRGGG